MVVPTYNERGNVEVLVDRLRLALADLTWRVVFVDDDSPDGTADAVKRMAAGDDRLQCLRRVGRRGLAGAVIEGILASASPFVAVIDGDLQHDETRLPVMLDALRSGADIAVGTRFASANGLAVGLSPFRRLGSRAATWAAMRVLQAEVSDPVSGFFAVRREIVERVAPKLSREGFKILFDIIASQPTPPRIVETPYAFAGRASGVSKFDSRVVVDYAALLLAKGMGDAIPARTIVFFSVASLGVTGHLAILAAGLGLGLGFFLAQAGAALGVAVTAYVIDTVMKGANGSIRALRFLNRLPWTLPGALANVAVAEVAHDHGAVWWLAGLSGAAIGATWTYASRER